MIMAISMSGCVADPNTTGGESEPRSAGAGQLERLEGVQRVPDEVVNIMHRGEWVQAARYGDEYFVEGDMQVVPDDASLRKGVSRRGNNGAGTYQWPNGVVNYRLGDFNTSGAATDSAGNPIDTTPEPQTTYYDAVRDAMNDWEAAVPGLRFQQVSSSFSGDFILIERDEGNACHSSVGRIGGRQRLHLSDWCFFFRDGAGNITDRRFSVHHEIGHALGLRHEHQRSDRASYVLVTQTGVNYDIDNVNYRDVGDYDCDSVMHYGLSSLRDSSGGLICPGTGQRDHLSGGDASSMRALYPVLRVQRSLFADSGDGRLCYLEGRRGDANTWFDVESSSSSLEANFDDTGSLDTSIGEGDYTVLNCSATSSFWVADYDYPATSRTLTEPTNPRESYAAEGSTSVRLMNLGLVAVLF